MSLLQDPLLALKQITWYLDSTEYEAFPGAFLLAAGNLSRQLLEQVVFILAFYSGMPRKEFLRGTGHLLTLNSVLRALHQTDPLTGKTYLTLARKRGPRIQKLARSPRTLDRWRHLLNEPSHFANPAAGREIKHDQLRAFVTHYGRILEPADAYLITAAVNELRSGGFIKAILTKDTSNKPGVLYTTTVTPSMIHYKDGSFRLRTPVPIVVVTKKEELPYRWRRKVVMVQDSGGMVLEARLVTSSGHPLNMNDFSSVLSTFASDPIDQPRLYVRLKQLGFTVTIADGVATASRRTLSPSPKSTRGTTR
jgi:hypothetical protein